jgi:hypothetical protein
MIESRRSRRLGALMETLDAARRPRRRRRIYNIGVVVLLTALGLVTGCQGKAGAWNGPSSAAPMTVKPWSTPTGVGRTIRTPHYLVHTTITDPQIEARLGQLMEGCLEQYEKLAPAVQISARPMECYIFGTREQWAAFTRHATGVDAPIYLRVNRGGYTIDDWYACYDIGEVGTFAVAAHEGWHQFVGRHFREPIPPFLEEGIGSTFQNVHWVNDLPRWNLSIDPMRVQRLRNVLERKLVIPLDQLAKMHAGEVVKMSRDRIEAFYTETWAFARFLAEGENGKYLPGFQSLLNDAALGTLHKAPGAREGEWNPELVKPLLEYYLRADLGTLDRELNAYMHTLAFERYGEQWREDAR